MTPPLSDDEHDILTPAQAADVLGIKPESVRVTMNRKGYGEVRGYRLSDVLAVRDTRQRRHHQHSDSTSTEET